MPQQFKTVIVEQMEEVFTPACEKVIEADDLVPLANQTFAQMRAQKTRTTSYKYSHSVF
jgi:hypothetical protein